MKRPALGLLALLALLPCTAAARGTFDAGLNGIRLEASRTTVRTFDFETPESLVGTLRVRWVETDGYPDIEQTPVTSPKDIVASLTDAAVPGDAIEGKHALRAKDGLGLAIVDPSIFSQVKDGRF